VKIVLRFFKKKNLKFFDFIFLPNFKTNFKLFYFWYKFKLTRVGLKTWEAAVRNWKPQITPAAHTEHTLLIFCLHGYFNSSLFVSSYEQCMFLGINYDSYCDIWSSHEPSIDHLSAIKMQIDTFAVEFSIFHCTWKFSVYWLGECSMCGK
jgi:hypothetical protein